MTAVDPADAPRPRQPRPMHVLVCGGAGYIGAHMCKALANAGHVPITLDNLSTGHCEAVKWGPLIHADLLDETALAQAFAAYPIDAVAHFAAKSIVAESMTQPALYLRNNVQGTRHLLQAMRKAGVERLVFSSTAAVYGNPVRVPIDESHPTQPINPYGESKLAAEQLIADACQSGALRAVAFRYFNAAGADPDGEIGEAHHPETHLLPLLIAAYAGIAQAPFTVNGTNHATADGTCVRDFVHVNDLCDAHLRAFEYLRKTSGFSVFNLGTGAGHSVAEVLALCESMFPGRPAIRYGEARAGDPPVLVADAQRAMRALGWKPVHSLSDCLATAARWHARADHGQRLPSVA